MTHILTAENTALKKKEYTVCITEDERQMLVEAVSHLTLSPYVAPKITQRAVVLLGELRAVKE